MGHLSTFLEEVKKRVMEMSCPGKSFPGRANSKRQCLCLVCFKYYKERRCGKSRVRKGVQEELIRIEKRWGTEATGGV